MFNPSTNSYASQILCKSFEVNEKKIKQTENQRIQVVEHGRFTPLVISTTGDMERKSKNFYFQLSKIVSDKRSQPYSIVAAWIGKCIIFTG